MVKYPGVEEASEMFNIIDTLEIKGRKLRVEYRRKRIGKN